MESRIEEATTDPKNLQQLHAMREEAGRRIDPETAEVTFSYCLTLDPYGDFSDTPEELRQVGREYFARSRGEDTWIWFGDLPQTTRDALWKRLTSSSATNGVDCLEDLSMIPQKTIQETEQLSGISATADIGEPMEDRPDPIERLYRLADESASVIAEMADEVEGYFPDDDARAYVQDGFARMVTARLEAMQNGKLKLHERWPTESEDDYVNRVARDEAGGLLEEHRRLIAATLGKHGALTEEQLKLMSAELLVILEKVEEESKNEDGQRWQRAPKRIGESDDEFVQRVGRDEAGAVLLKKRQILATALRKLGDLTQEEIRQMSAETLVVIEKAYDFSEYAADFFWQELLKRWRPLVAYWDFLRRTETADTQSAEFTDEFPF